MRIGPNIVARPNVFGAYWAYVFPISALATSAVQNAVAEGTAGARGLAAALVGLATLTIAVVVVRMTLHHVQVRRGRAEWPG